MPLTTALIDAFIKRYKREYDLYAKLASFVAGECQQLLQEHAIRGSVQWRPKAADRLKKKLLDQMRNGENAAEYTDVDSVYRVLKDLAGVRVTTYVESDRQKVVDLIVKRFGGFESDGSIKPDIKDSKTNYYRATHCLVKVTEEDLEGNNENLEDARCEIQVCSLLAHVYNEIEHDLRYKTLSGELEKHENGLLNILGKLTETGDTVITETLDAVKGRQQKNTAAFEDVHDFVSRTRQLFPQATDFGAYAGQLFDACMKLGIDNVDKLKEALKWDDNTPQRGFELAKKLAAKVNGPQDTYMNIYPTTSDLLLVLLVEDEERVNKLNEFYPKGYGKGRPRRLMVVARQLAELEDKK
ncbi:MAG: RelA/SpoT domain-containing protein [Flavobacteriales bacterium]|nr:RelA/SpoT domain-containing protein [Flavobacteriales bacterium]